MKFTQAALFGAVTLVAAERHNHAHRHPARHGSPVEVRDVSSAAVVTVPGPVTTVYELDGHDISYEDVEEGLKNGKYTLIGDNAFSAAPSTTYVAPTTSTTPTSTPTSTPAPTAPSAEIAAAVFFQESTSSTSSEEPTTTPTALATPTPSPTTSSESSASSSSSSSSSSDSSDSSDSWPDFPSGTIECSNFPSEYGAVYIDYLGFSGWSGIQYASGFAGDLSLSTAITELATAISGQGCTSGAFCSYACKAGYQKIQWPKSQGSTGQSVGGIYCNNDGFLELTREEESQLCGPGAGGVTIKNSLSTNIPVCRTDYPGTESETVPLNCEAGQTYPLTNPISADYYTWEGSATTAQYYINLKGSDVSEACTWNSPGSNLGNYAPGNIGVGVGAGGITYISMFPNHPSNPDGTMDYNIKITGDGLVGDCSYTDGVYYSSGTAMANGCTVSFPSGGSAEFEFY